MDEGRSGGGAGAWRAGISQFTDAGQQSLDTSPTGRDAPGLDRDAVEAMADARRAERGWGTGMVIYAPTPNRAHTSTTEVLKEPCALVRYFPDMNTCFAASPTALVATTSIVPPTTPPTSGIPLARLITPFSPNLVNNLKPTALLILIST